MRRFVDLFFIYLLALCATPLAVAGDTSTSGIPQAAGAGHKQVLILYAYNNNVPTLQQITTGIGGVLKSSNLRSADFVHEYLDITPPKYPEHSSMLAELLLHKYAGQQFDLIVTYSTEALNFLLNEGKELSPGSPCIAMFAALKQEIGQSGRKITHIPMELDPRGTLERGLELFPQTRRVLFVSGTAAIDKVFENQARSEFASWQGKLEFDYTSQRSVEDLIKEIVQLPPNTLIIFSNLASDITGKSFVPRDLVKSLASIANAPVLSMFSTQIDTGVIGGSMIDMERLGVMIGNVMVALDGGKPLTIEPASSFIRPMFNWTQIKRWGVDPDRLPAESIFINRPLTLWGQYKAEVVTAISLILILSTMTIALVIQNRRRKFAETSVRETAAQLQAERDILEERVTERTARLSEALDFNETMLLNSPVPMGIYAESGQCELANEAFAQLVGATVEQLMAQNFHEIASWKTTSLLGDCLTALKLHTPLQREANLVTSFGKDVWFEYRILPRKINGEVHLLIQFFDLTERKARQFELERRVVARTAELATAKVEAESANAVKTRFMANVSHEMRTPMNGILGLADIGKRKVGKVSDEALSGYFDKILDSGKRLNKLTESLLSLAQDAFNEQSEIKEQDLVMVEPESIAIQAISLLEETAASRQQKIVLENTSTIPMIVGDELRLRQVLEHLLSNALRYSPEQTTVTIRIQDAPAFSETPTKISIQVIDQGCGIPEQELKAIFEPFYESTRTATGAGGTGLGLPLSKSIVGRHKGTLTASNRPEGGSIFEVTLPQFPEA